MKNKNGFFARLFLKAAAYSGASFDTMNHELVRKVFGETMSAAGRSVTDESAMTLSAVWSCMRILSETIGSLPWALYKRGAKGSSEKDSAHPLAQLLVAPNRDMTGAEYREALVLNLCQSGNAYSSIDRVGGKVTSLYPVPSRFVTPKIKRNNNTRLTIPDGVVFYTITTYGVPVDYRREEIWHIKGFGPNGLVGLSPLTYARETMGFALATEEFGSRFFSQGGKPSGTVTIPNFLTNDQRDAARANLQQMLGGMGNAHKFALFEGGMKPEPWGDMPLKDMEFLLLRKFSVTEISRIYRVPPHMISELDKATFSNIEQQAQEFVNYTLMPYFTRIEASFARWILTPVDQETHYLKFNANGLLRGDSAARSALYSSGVQNGWINRNEVRALEDLNRVEGEGMDAYTVQANMVTLEELDGKMEREEQAKREAADRLAANPPAAPVAGGEAAEEPVFTPPKIAERIAARKEAEDREAKHEERLAAIIASAPAPVINMPPINIAPAPAPIVNVTVQKNGMTRTLVERDEDGNILATRTEDVPPPKEEMN